MTTDQADKDYEEWHEKWIKEPCDDDGHDMGGECETCTKEAFMAGRGSRPKRMYRTPHLKKAADLHEMDEQLSGERETEIKVSADGEITVRIRDRFGRWAKGIIVNDKLARRVLKHGKELLDYA